jgi:hypothetical protein
VAKAAPAVDPEKPGDASEQPPAEAPASSLKRRLIIIGAPVALAGIGSGLWFSGILPRLLGIQHETPTAEADTPSQPLYQSAEKLLSCNR